MLVTGSEGKSRGPEGPRKFQVWISGRRLLVQSTVDISKSKPKLLISQSKFSGSRKFTLRYKLFGIKGNEMTIKVGNVSKLRSLI